MKFSTNSAGFSITGNIIDSYILIIKHWWKMHSKFNVFQEFLLLIQMCF